MKRCEDCDYLKRDCLTGPSWVVCAVKWWLHRNFLLASVSMRRTCDVTPAEWEAVDRARLRKRLMEALD